MKKVRRIDRINTTHPAECIPVAVETQFVPTSVPTDDGVLTTSYEEKTIDPRPLLNGYKVSDFAMSNLIATGSAANLAPMSPLAKNDIFAAAAHAEEAMFALQRMDSIKASLKPANSTLTVEPSTPSANE